MKQLFKLILVATMTAFVVAGCSDDGNEPQPNPTPDPETPAAPSFSWAGQNMDAVHPIEVDANGALIYSAVIEISAPGKIATLTVDITSPLINDEYDIDKLDLIHPDEQMSALLAMAPELSVGEQIAGQTSCTFNLTALLPQLAESTGEHDFAVTVTDEAGQSTDQTFRFSSVNPDDPSFSWVDANGRAIDQNAVYNVAENGTVDGQYPPVIEISVPRQIAALTLDFASDKDKYNDQGLIPLDLINPDADMLSFITQFNLSYGDAVLNQSSYMFDVSGILTRLWVGGEYDFTLAVTDKAGRSVTQTFKFCRNYAPHFAWNDANGDYIDMNAIHPVAEIGTGEGQYPAAIELSVMGKIAELSISIHSAALNPIGFTTLDLVNPDEATKELLDQILLAYGDAVHGQSACTLDLTGFMPMLATTPGEHDFAVTVTDELGQSTTQTFKFNVADPDSKIIYYTMGEEDYKLVVDYVLAQPGMDVYDDPRYPGDAEYYYGFDWFYREINFRLTGSPSSSREIQGSVDNDTALHALDGDTDAQAALLWKRLVEEAMPIYLRLKYPDAVAQEGGCSVHYSITLNVYYPDCKTNTTSTFALQYKVLTDGTPSAPPTFAYVSGAYPYYDL